jgi:hypothetical protein
VAELKAKLGFGAGCVDGVRETSGILSSGASASELVDKLRRRKATGG